MWYELWKSATSSVSSTFSFGTATKSALILVGVGVVAMGAGMLLKGTADIVDSVKNRELEEEDFSEEKQSSDDE